MTTLGHVLEERVVRCPTLTPAVDVVSMSDPLQKPAQYARERQPSAARLTGTGPHGQ